MGENRYTVRTPPEVETTENDERAFIEKDRGSPGPLRRTRHFADVDSLWVRGPFRRRGVAGRLLAALVSWAREHPEIEKLGLFVFSTNGAAIRLYERHGFAVEGRYPRDVKFEDGSYADTVAIGVLVKDRDG